MCTAEEVRKITHHEIEIALESRQLTPLAKWLIGLLVIAFGSAVGFNATANYAMKDAINEIHNATKDGILKVVNTKHDNVLKLVATNMRMIEQTKTWQEVHLKYADGVISRIDLMMNTNAVAIRGIVETKADDRWRGSDERADNKNKALMREADNKNNTLIHFALEKEDKNIRRLLADRYQGLITRFQNIEESIEEGFKRQHELYDRLELQINQGK